MTDATDATDGPPECAHRLGHHWVSGRAKKTENGITIVSRQCRSCGYEQEIPEEKRMTLKRTCGVEGCDDVAVATLYDTDPGDGGDRCRECLLFDLGI